jgi:hypothetical protein
MMMVAVLPDGAFQSDDSFSKVEGFLIKLPWLEILFRLPDGRSLPVCDNPPEQRNAFASQFLTEPQTCRLLAGALFPSAASPPSAQVPPTSEPQGINTSPLSRQEAEAAVRAYLQQHPDASIRQVQKATGVSIGRISKLPVWQAHLAKKAATPAPTPSHLPKERRLTERMLASTGREYDPSERMELEEAAWVKLQHEADEEERARLKSFDARGPGHPDPDLHRAAKGRPPR